MNEGLWSQQVFCPYCGESIELLVDISVSRQSYIEDCPVCCRPITVQVQINADEIPVVTPYREDD
ncbi:MAG: CPXCG motif-containing cysteine-rich protein [candidate division KSB1 bacterium]|nr:CPXCG motif-containing cysteine-rich protein [candidate division KSB1 bacterium]